MAAPKAVALAAQYPQDVKLVFKHFPLDFHSNAYHAAEASLAAHAQGKFWQLHDKMFANFRQLTRENILLWAEEAGLDMGAFKADLASGKYRSTIVREVNEGTGAGVMGTPTFFINGKQIELKKLTDPTTNQPTLEAFSKAIDAAIKEQSNK